MPRNRERVLAALSAPLLTLLAVSPALAATASAQATASAHQKAPSRAVAAAPEPCHLLGRGPGDAYHKGCRAGYLLGKADGKKTGTPPICQKVLPPLSPVNPTDYERGKTQGYRTGYDEAFATAYAANCKKPPEPPKKPDAPPPQQQTPDTMFAAGKTAGEGWGREDAKQCDPPTRAHSDLVPPSQPNTLILAYQNGYRLGYQTAYDEAFRDNCLKP
ncbi:hypothetical protein ACIQWN_14445 [Streptomyces vinaceus]|uniref:hypothetical protein n=1 Tax=Streptomyces vinaceus TaxID=1960 RepID=UPI00381569EC